MSNIEGDQMCQDGKRRCLPFECIFILMSFISVFVECIRKDEFSKNKPQVRMTSKMMQHNMELFFAANWDSPKRSVKLLGHEQRSDFYHNQITPLSEGMWGFLQVYRFQFDMQKLFSVHWKKLLNPSYNTRRDLDIMHK